jgi:hypothetical protein
MFVACWVRNRQVNTRWVKNPNRRTTTCSPRGGSEKVEQGEGSMESTGRGCSTTHWWFRRWWHWGGEAWSRLDRRAPRHAQIAIVGTPNRSAGPLQSIQDPDQRLHRERRPAMCLRWRHLHLLLARQGELSQYPLSGALRSVFNISFFQKIFAPHRYSQNLRNLQNFVEIFRKFQLKLQSEFK